MEKGEGSAAEKDAEETTQHHLTIPAGLTQDEFDDLKRIVAEFHKYPVGPGKCSSLLAQRVYAPLDAVWSVVRRFDKPQTYKHFIRSCTVKEGFKMTAGCTRDVNVISGLPAATSTERLDLLDDDCKYINTRKHKSNLQYQMNRSKRFGGKIRIGDMKPQQRGIKPQQRGKKPHQRGKKPHQRGKKPRSMKPQKRAGKLEHELRKKIKNQGREIGRGVETFS
ncbi:abscisic acid receptor PYL1-like [Prunus avium]|uniref:Abscisic acid receptor PYL1-like n=1 Tax=Prunus avium TaxID=42229 RepID=A0A6P5TK06_PRUAV|nr:abscisic acid receptor PYL1-like [Prunus avium]